ncbi:MAG TPA: arylsulfatase [Planctomycetota bacterium]|nr:arylsulfatase [Planctomycetota bacterium]
MRTMLLALLLITGSSAAVPQDVPPRPNILILLADDMGFSDIGCYGSEIATPNLDRLAAGGLRFTQFYNNARCCPTRASLLTGLYSHQAGIGHMVENKGAPGYQGFLNDRCVTLAEALRPAGYFTAMAGKWHVGDKRPHWPADRGFERYYGLIGGGSNYFKIDSPNGLALDGERVSATGDDFYMTDAFTDHALKFLDEAKEKKKPFLLYTAFTSPHWPLHARPQDIAKYRGKYAEGWDVLRAKRHRKMIELGIVDATWPLTARDAEASAWEDAKDKDDLDLRMAVYAAQIDRMDQNIGRILGKLREIGAEENTLVLFLSDNGGCAESIHRGKAGAVVGTVDSYESYGLPWANASNTPFRLYKHWVHEGGISTPLIASWPAVIKKSAFIREPAHLIDLMPTCLELAKAEYPKDKTPPEGLSLVPLLRTGAWTGHDAIFWEHEGNRAVRQGKWKLVARHKGAWELYDLEADRTELKNVAAEHPDRVKEMTAKHDAWAARVGVVPWDELNRKK